MTMRRLVACCLPFLAIWFFLSVDSHNMPGSMEKHVSPAANPFTRSQKTTFHSNPSHPPRNSSGLTAALTISARA
ncbi:hypothetical protein B0H14DRAFT_2454063 [Mycena olivaceomarginata]|nr:hypothetical protein B0H14DRAFT_2454063 [Mycena olivaceomarginata]